MTEVVVAIAIAMCLICSSIGATYISPRLPARHRDDDTAAVVRLVANIFVVMTSLVFGLMINSAKNTYASIDSSVHVYATNLIILDRTLRTAGLSGVETRNRLAAYVEEAIANPARANDATDGRADTANAKLDAIGDALYAISPVDSYHEAVLVDMQQQYRRLVEQRWGIIEQSEGTIPAPLVVMLVAWLILIFGSFGYRAPRNEIVLASLAISALLVAMAFYLVLDMNSPFSGPIQISDAPLRRALAEMRT